MATILIAIFLILFVGLRSSTVGTDSARYADELIRVDDGRFGPFDRQSPGYWLIELIVAKLFGCDYTVLYMICALITWVFFFLALKKNSVNPFLSLLVFIGFGFAYETLNQIRQMMAVSVVLFAYTYLKANQRGRFALLVLIASSLHITALCALFMVFLTKLKPTVAHFVAALSLILLFVGFENVFHSAISRIPIFGKYVGSAFDVSGDPKAIIHFVIRAALFLILLGLREKTVKAHPSQDLLLAILLVGVIIQGAALSMSILARVSTFYIVFFIFAIPNAISALSRRSQSLATVLTTILFAVMFLGITFLKNPTDYVYLLAGM